MLFERIQIANLNYTAQEIADSYEYRGQISRCHIATYLYNRFGAYCDHLVEFSVVQNLTDRSVMSVRHLHVVLYSPGQRPSIQHTRC